MENDYKKFIEKLEKEEIIEYSKIDKINSDRGFYVDKIKERYL